MWIPCEIVIVAFVALCDGGSALQSHEVANRDVARDEAFQIRGDAGYCALIRGVWAAKTT
jgi:hypothetical protein